MRTLIRAIWLLILFVPVAARAEVLKISIDDTIHPITEEYIGRALERAHKEHASALLIELRTPGGLVDSTRKIVEKMLASDVPVIVYVTPSGGYAASAGFFILQAADVAAMAPGTNTGAAHPVLGLGVKVDDVMKSKMENDAAAFMRSFVSKRGRNLEAAESAVRESKSFTEQEALDKKIIDLVAKDDADLLRQLDGRTITRFNGSTALLHTAGQSITEIPMTLKMRVLAFLMDPNIAYLLFSIGMLALYAEFNHPGAIVPGVVGVILILLSVFAFNLLPTRYAALALIVTAFGMFALEVKFQTHGALGIGGTVMMVLGALLLVDGPIPEMRVKLWTALSVSVPMALITIFLMSIALRAHRNKVVTGTEGMIGMLGVAHTALAPAGKIVLNGEYWNAHSAAPVAPGESVRVRSVAGLEVEVDKVE